MRPRWQWWWPALVSIAAACASTIFLGEGICQPGAVLERLNGDGKGWPLVWSWDIFEHSPYFADELLRQPELLDEIGAPPMEPSEPLDEGSALRRFYRRQMLRIQSESILAAAPIFTTLRKTSALADRVIDASYRIAVMDSLPPASLDYTPRDQMTVISARPPGHAIEFDLGSDADLIFVLPDADAGELTFWTGVAERMIQDDELLHRRRRDVFTIDTRVCVPTYAVKAIWCNWRALTRAISNAARRAWEGIHLYEVARAVAGNLDRATEFLHELQEVDWRRYGQSMRSRKGRSGLPCAPGWSANRARAIR